ncbi:Transducin/WD40 repeat superfamily protein [Trifolium repens]|nr:Transducin/WD40 repeat superfamily protein [Trifolium repens]
MVIAEKIACMYLGIRLYRYAENTNQQILFDIDPSGQHLVTGGRDGSVHIYDLQTGQWVSSFEAAQGTEDLYSLKLPVVIFYLNLGFNIKYILNLSPLSDLLVS